MTTDQTVRLVFLGEAGQALNSTNTVTTGVRRLSAAQKEQAATSRTVTAEAGRQSAGMRNLEHELGRTSRGALAGSGAFRGLGRSIAFASASFLGGYGLLAVVRSTIGVMEEASTNAAATTARIKATGGAAGVTAKQIDVLAVATERKTGLDVETVHAAENVLLTFTEVRNELGKGNQIYTRAVALASDLARAMKEDVSTAALQLGRALDDPVRGLTTLTRAGITFTAAQREQIKALAESGRILEAQKIILDTVAGKVGGVANAQGDLSAQSQRLHSDVRLLEKDFAEGLTPALGGLVDEADKWVKKLEQNKPEQERFRNDIVGIAKGVGEVAHVLHEATDAVGGTKNALEILVGLKVALWLKDVVVGLDALIGTEAAAGGAGLLGATGQAKGLFGWLTRLKGIGLITVGVLWSISQKGESTPTTVGPDGHRYVTFGGKSYDLGPDPGTAKSGATGTAPSTTAEKGRAPGGPAAMNTGRQKLINFALSMLGTPYAWGGAGPGGFDCSGLVMWAFGQTGVNIPHNSVAQFTSSLGTPVSKANLKAGDVVFGPGSDGTLAAPGHEAIYIGNGMVVEAPQTGKKVRTLPLSEWIKYAGGYSGARDFTGGSTRPPRRGRSGGSGPSQLQTLELALAQAGVTKTTADDRAALQALVAFYKKAAAAPGLPITTRTQDLLQQGSYQSQLDALTPKGKGPTKASAAALINIHHTLDAVTKLVDSSGLAKRFDPELAKINKELGAKFVTSATLAKIRNQLSDITKATNAELKKARDAVAANKKAFADTWAQLATDAFAAFDAETASHISPSRALLNQLTEAHDAASLQQALTDAQKQLADAQAGVGSSNDSGTLDQIRNLVGQAALANAIDAAQSNVLGISPSQVSSQGLITQLQQLLVQQNVPDAQAIADAQRAVDEAQYNIRVADLGKQADAEDTAYNLARAALRTALEINLGQWDTYYQRIGEKASKAAGDFAAVWAAALAGIPTSAGGTSDASDFKTIGSGFNIPSGVIGGGFGGSFDSGGIVPGLLGQPKLILAHGGERVQTHAQQAGGLAHVHLTLGEGLDQLVDAKIVKATPGISLTIGRAADVRRRSRRY